MTLSWAFNTQLEPSESALLKRFSTNILLGVRQSWTTCICVKKACYPLWILVKVAPCLPPPAYLPLQRLSLNSLVIRKPITSTQMCSCSYFTLAHTLQRYNQRYVSDHWTRFGKDSSAGPWKKGLISVLWNPIAAAVIESPDSSPASIHAGRFLQTRDHICWERDGD